MMLRNYYIIIFASFVNLFFIASLQAQSDVDTTLEQGGDEAVVAVSGDSIEAVYRANNFVESIKLYEAEIAKMKTQNKASAELYYNLGNAYFRNNQIAKAIVNYERALLLNPGDSDIRHNLLFAKTRIEDKIDSADNFFVNKWIRGIQNLYSANKWGGIGIVLFILFIIAVGLYLVSSNISIRKISFYVGIVLFLSVIITNTFAFKQKQKIVNRSTAIVMSASVSIYTSPDAHSQELFRLHEGTKVRIKRKEGRWIEIQIANGSVGWLQKNNIEII